jgi:asparagine synthase (glutamine-hydrolysing)
LRRLPTAVRRGLAATLGPLARRSGASSTNSRVKRLAQYLRAAHCGDLYEIQMSPRLDEKDLVLRCGGSPPDWDYALGRGTLYDEMMFADGSSYLPDDILVKVDRASMGVSLESRVPLLDHRVVEFAWRMPLHLKIRNNEGKWLLKKVLQKYLPLSLVERPKMGFGVPVGAWIRGPLRDWAENLLSANRLTQQGFLDAKLVRNHWSHYVNNDASSDDSIWQLLMFQEWLQNEATYDADGQR